MSETTSRDCVYCSGAGCEECDGTGQRVTTTMELDGVPVHIHGSSPLTTETQAALGKVMHAAFARLFVQAGGEE